MVTEVVNRPNLFGFRHGQVLLLFCSFTCSYIIRSNMSAAIVPMTKPSQIHSYLDWQTFEKSLVLSSFLWGFSLSQIHGSMIAKRYGAKKVLGWVLVLAAVLTFLHPLTAEQGWPYLMTVRIFVGLLDGIVNPCVHDLLAKWAPRTERSFLATIVFCGTQFGPALVVGTSGVISSSIIGWSGIFYLSGSLTLMSGLLVIVFGAESPDVHRTISPEEKNYIQSLNGSHNQSHEMPIPWRAIFSSLPFWGFVAAHCSYSWGFNIFLTEIPTYMVYVLQYKIKDNALLSALPYLVMLALGLLISPIADSLNNRNITSITTSRKLFNSIGQWIPMSCLLALGYLTANEKTLAVILLTLGVGFSSTCSFGVLVNDIDLSPNFAGVLTSVSNAMANLLSVFAPLLVGALVTTETDPNQWRVVFFITSAIYLIGNILFLIYGRGSIQPWNDINFKKRETNLTQPEHDSKDII